MRSFPLLFKVYVADVLVAAAGTPELAAVIATHLRSGAVVKADRKIVWKTGVVCCTIPQAAALIDSAWRDVDHGSIVRGIFTRYRGPECSYEDLCRSIQRKLKEKSNV